jgi:hypothetical protein
LACGDLAGTAYVPISVFEILFRPAFERSVSVRLVADSLSRGALSRRQHGMGKLESQLTRMTSSAAHMSRTTSLAAVTGWRAAIYRCELFQPATSAQTYLMT